MLYLVEEFDDPYLKSLVDILHKEVEKCLELFSRPNLENVPTAENLSKIIGQYIKWASSLTGCINKNYNVLCNQLNIDNQSYGISWEQLFSISKLLIEQQTQIFNIIKEIREDKIFEIYGTVNLPINTYCSDNVSKIFKQNASVNKHLQKFSGKNKNENLCSLDRNSLLEQVENLSKTLSVTINDEINHSNTVDEMLINFNSEELIDYKFSNDTKNLSEKCNRSANCEQPSLIKTELNSTELNVNDFKKLSLSVCSSKFEQDLSNLNFQNSTNLERNNYENREIFNGLENNFPKDLNKDKQFEYDFLNYLISQAKQITQNLQIPDIIPKKTTSKFILGPITDLHRYSELFKPNESSLIPKNWPATITDTDTDNHNDNIFAFEVSQISRKEETEDFTESVLNELKHNLNNSEHEKINMDFAYQDYPINLEDITSSSNSQKSNSEFFQLNRKIINEIQQRQKLIAKIKKVSDEAILCDNLPDNFQDFERHFEMEYSKIEKSLTTSLQNMFDNNCEKIIEQKLAKIRNNFLAL